MGNNSGRYSKFQERLKRIVRNRFKRKKKGLGIVEEKKSRFYNEGDVRRIIDANKEVIRKNVNVKRVYVSNKKVKGKEVSDSLNIEKDIVIDQKKEILEDSKGKVVSEREINDKRTNVKSNSLLKEKSNGFKDKDVFKDRDIDVLGIELLEKIRCSFNDKLDQIKVLESELYLVSDDLDNVLEMKKINEIKKKIKKILGEINKLIEEYNLYNKNYYMESFVGIEDQFLESDIVDYRRLLDSCSKEKEFVREYKLLDEFKNLYGKLCDIKNETDNLVEVTEKKTNDFDIRDKKYKVIVDGVLKITNVEMECLGKIREQNKYLKELSERIDKIEKEEYVTTHLRGVGELISTSLRYVGLRMLSPLSGLIPSIAVNTLMTRELIGNIRKNLYYEDVRHVYYKTVDYDRELTERIVDVDYTEDLILDTIDDIKKLKEDFFRQYNSNIPGYDDTLKKINEVENIIYRNQYSISNIKKRLIQNKKINQNKLVRVKRMNKNN